MSIRPEPVVVHRKRGTLAEMTALLTELAEGWEHLGKPARAAAARDAISGLQEGSFSVRVGVTTYTVAMD